MTTKTTKLFYIKERDNPQLSKPYYTAYGQLSKTAAKRKESTLYGANAMHSFATAEEYRAEIARLKAEGFTVYDDL